MKQIDDYVNSIYKNVDGNKKEIEELKEEMRLHLLEDIEELKQQGNSEKTAINIAINRFGEKKVILKELSKFFSVQKRLGQLILSISILFLLLCIFFIFKINIEIKEFRADKISITKDVLAILDNTNEIPPEKNLAIEKIYKKYNEHLNKLAVFKLDNNESLQDWLTENPGVQRMSTNVYPINYDDAELIFGQKGNGSKYDLGTVAQANEGWIVQYEYKDSYKKVIENNNLSLLGKNTDLYHLPILLFSVFMVLFIVWMIMKKSNSTLRKTINF